MNNFPSDYVRRSELARLLDVLEHQRKEIVRLGEALDRTLRLVERQQEEHNKLVALYDAMCDELDRSYAGIDTDFSNLADAIECVAEAAGVPCPLQRIPDEERDESRPEDGEPVPPEETEDPLMPPTKKVLH